MDMVGKSRTDLTQTSGTSDLQVNSALCVCIYAGPQDAH